MTRPRVVLHAAGGPQIGVGHLRRCATLAAAIAARDIADVTLLLQADEGLAGRYWVPGAQLVAVPNFATGLAARARLARAGGSDVLVTDLLGLRRADGICAREQGFTRLVHINDDTANGYEADLFVLGDIGASAEKAGLPPERVIAGARYHCVPADVAARRPATPRPGEPATNLLITLGGADPGRQTEALLEGLAGLGHPLPATVVAGPAFGVARLRGLHRLRGADVHIVEAPVTLAPLLETAELVVTLGGLTTYEAMCLGRPAAALSWGPMAEAVPQLAATGVLADVGTGPEAGARVAELAADPTSLGLLAWAGWEQVDGRGATRVAAEIERLAIGPASPSRRRERV